VPEFEALKAFANRHSQGLITDPAQNKAVQNFLTTESATKPEVEKGMVTTVKSHGKLLVHVIRLEHH
jgi:hypothetical protein